VPVADGPVAELARLAPIDGRESLADQVYGRLREAITSGALAPGLRLREVPLSQQFGVSTTPVREALRRLENDGLVETNPHRGALVAGFSLRVVGELFEVREVLERRGARLAAAAPVRDLSKVEELLRRAAALVDEPDQVAFNRLDVAFHRAVDDVGGNRSLAEMAERAHRQIQAVRVRCAIYLPGQPRWSQRDHADLAEAIRRGDPDSAEELIARHICRARDAVIAALVEFRKKEENLG